MKEIIEKAIEGGYKYRGGDITLRTWCLDPLFFRALGKACGWNMGDRSESVEFRNEHGKDLVKGYFNSQAEYFALRFHEINLTEGFDAAVDYLKTLL